MSRARKPEGGSVVYFLQEGGPDGPIKIGMTTDWSEKRARALQTGNSQPLKVLCFVPGGRATEAGLHHDFQRHHIRGEWYRADPEILGFIIDVLNGVRRGRAVHARLETLARRDVEPMPALSPEQVEINKAGAARALAALEDGAPFVPKRRI